MHFILIYSYYLKIIINSILLFFIKKLEKSSQHQPPPQEIPVIEPVAKKQQRQLSTSEPDNLEDNRLEEEVAKLIDGASPRDEKPPGVMSTKLDPHQSAQNSSNSAIRQEKWFYRDPQGEVQGPFLASEMAEWHKQGYFASNLQVRRTCDERYTTLGELVEFCGRVPFKPGINFPPLKVR